MDPFTTLTSVAAPFPEAQIDTDVIFPARFLLLLDKHGLGRHLFHERRAKGGFVLDTPPYDTARIMVTGPDFGTGSSREQAVWALVDFGIRCVIGPSFGEIFHANCFRNGVLPIVLTGEDLTRVQERAATGLPMTVDLPEGCIRIGNETPIPFTLEPHHRRALLEGLDEIDIILADDLADIRAHEDRQRKERPWLFLTPSQLSHFDDIREDADD
jgi:3-isopropylmalate/(R)-2-methylmalate dehydratase small subunit